jgi:uncharacterized protein (TIGR02677 family)
VVPVVVDASAPSPFSHVVADKAELYRAVMGAFVLAKQRFLVHLRSEDVLEAVRGAGHDVDLAEVGALLTQLKDWQNLRADPDTARVTTVEDFNRARFLYQLTAEGEAAEAALAAYDAALGRRGELQAVALSDIRTTLRALEQLAGGAAPDAGRVHALLRDLVGVFEGLAANAQAFMAGLQRTMQPQGDDVAAFLAYKDRLVGYIERFIGDLVTASADIAATLRRLDPHVQALLRVAADREAADAAPGGDGASEAAVAERLAAWQARWLGLRQWFVGQPDRPAQAALLRARARQAISGLLGLVATLNERRAGRSDRSADFRALARWFAEAPDDAAAHRLWRAAFGLSPARHLTVDGDTLDARAADPPPPSASWREAPPVVVSPRLRATGTHERRGQPARVVDRSAERAVLAAQFAAEAAQAEAVRTSLLTDGPVRLSSLGELDADRFAELLRLLGDALSAAVVPGDTVRVTTGDGALVVTLAPCADGSVAELRTPDGVLRGPDHRITIARAGAQAAVDLVEAGAP